MSGKPTDSFKVVIRKLWPSALDFVYILGFDHYLLYPSLQKGTVLNYKNVGNERVS